MDAKIGERIKAKRKERGLTQVELGMLIGVTHATISRWEKGIITNITGANVLRLCNILQCPPGWLMGDYTYEVDNETIEVMNAISSEAHFMASIMDACERYGDIGKNFTDDDWREIVAYIKMKASIRDA